MLCRDCSSARRSPLFQVSAGSLATASLVCLGVAVLGGWLLADMGGGLGLFSLWLGFLYGLVIAEVALRITGRKRGIQMEILAGTCAALGIVAGWALSALLHGGPDPVTALIAHLLHPWSYLLIGLAAFSAVSRIRYI
jgi:hypothetical protein